MLWMQSLLCLPLPLSVSSFLSCSLPLSFLPSSFLAPFCFAPFLSCLPFCLAPYLCSLLSVLLPPPSFLAPFLSCPLSALPTFCLVPFLSCSLLPFCLASLSVLPPFCLALPFSAILLTSVLLPGFPDVWPVRTQRVKLYILWIFDGEVELPARISEDRNELKMISQPFWGGCQVFVTECLTMGVLFERS